MWRKRLETDLKKVLTRMEVRLREDETELNMTKAELEERDGKAADDYFQKLVRVSREIHEERRAQGITNVRSQLAEAPPPEVTTLPVVACAGRYEHLDRRRIDQIAATIYAMNAQQAKRALEDLQLKPSKYATLKKMRAALTKAIRQFKASELASADRNSNRTLRHFEYLVVMDVECTCIEEVVDYPHEIIEWPAVLVDVREKKIIDSFHTYVRPVKNTILDPFCTEFTGITQKQVDEAPFFPEAFEALRLWLLEKHHLGRPGRRYAFVTDGEFDVARYIQNDCLEKLGHFPHEFRHYIDIKRIFHSRQFGQWRDVNRRDLRQVEHGPTGRRISSIQKMLSAFHMDFEGSPHAGRDDAYNIARLVKAMLERNIELWVNQRCRSARDPTMDMRTQQAIEQSKTEAQKTLQRWKLQAKYAPVDVTRSEFLSGTYKECDSCDEAEDETV